MANEVTIKVTLDAPELAGVEEGKAAQIRNTFAPMVETLEGIEERYKEVLNAFDNTDEEKEFIANRAKRLRLDIKQIRVDTEHKRKELKEAALREGKAIDGVSNILKWAIAEKEAALKKIEDYAAEEERKRKETLQQERLKELWPFMTDLQKEGEPPVLSEMDAEVWGFYIEGKKKEHEDRIAAEKAAEEARIAAEQKEKLHNERLQKLLPYQNFRDQDDPPIDLREAPAPVFDEYLALLEGRKKKDDEDREAQRIENERLRKEAEEAEKKRQEEAEEQRKKDEEAAAKLKAETEAKQKAEAELKAKQEEERVKKEQEAARIEAEKQAELKKGDAERVEDFKQKLITLHDEALNMELKSDEAKTAIQSVSRVALFDIIEHIEKYQGVR